MLSRETRQYNDAKKAPDSSSCSDVGKKYKTHEDRCWNFKRFLTPLALGTMTLAARMGGVEARPEALGSAPALVGSDNPTGRLPAFPDQQSRFIDNSLSERYFLSDEHAKHVADTLKKLNNPPFYFDGPKDAPSSAEISQSTMEIRQGEQDKGKEPLKPEEVKMASLQARKDEVKANRKVLEHVWSSVLRRELAVPDNFPTSIVFVHGLNGQSLKGSSAGHDCSRDWSNAMSVLASHGYKDFRTIQFYKGDSNCNANLLDSKYSKPCANYNADAGPEGTNDESLYHISCKLAQFLGQEFGQSNSNVVLVGHSMGGIIVRETMYQMQENAGQSPFPKTIGHITDAITFTTPHSGIVPFDTLPPASYFVCNGCTQGREMEQDFSILMWDLRTRGQNPQTSGGFTRWTVVGSECDSVLQESTSLVVGGTGVASAVDMHASYAIMYAQDNKPSSSTSCYTHFNPTEDKSTQQDAHLYYCDTSNPDKSPCGTAYNEGGNWKYTGNGPHSLLAMYDATTGNLP
jgi:hypothetical protein